ncbi:hypothetical protein CGLAU_08120 [Corynebacterium glaucum]|uniref:Uncharacterized protein n=1 Tax=Corynebacterium glaucum TaxID=187491 RepID=A0A1Q2HXL9_9CORY|nr:hypothetical protein [Corynebacterium glaucum]AQQ15579.1 hypothetical protein CGLAU_08120 [Corynebacterium glaucum]
MSMRLPQLPLPIEQIIAGIVGLLTVIGLIVGLNAGTGSGSSDKSSSTATTVTSTPVTSTTPTTEPGTGTGPASRDSDITPNRSIKQAQETAWSKWEKVEGSNAVRIFYTTGTPECYGQYADVEETDTEVKVRLYSGALPNAPEACIAIALEGSMVVPLKAPLGDRKVVQVAKP